MRKEGKIGEDGVSDFSALGKDDSVIGTETERLEPEEEKVFPGLREDWNAGGG